MNEKFVFSCESTVDMPYEYFLKRNVEVIDYTYQIDGIEYIDNMGRDEKSLENFYKLIDEGHMPSTSQINEYRYKEYFEKLLKKGNVLHLAFGTGVTPSYHNAVRAANQIMEENPNAEIIVIDTKCASSGYGMFVEYVLDLRDEGKTIDEILNWIEPNIARVHSEFFSTDFRMFKRSGRVSGLTATLGTFLGICPIMHLDSTGKMVSYDKTRGKKAAINSILSEMKNHAIDGTNYSGKCFISHSNYMEGALLLKEKIESEFHNISEVKIYDIGNIIASHTGPGTIALFYMGDERR
jgi:DegV family protein with EDD domain